MILLHDNREIESMLTQLLLESCPLRDAMYIHRKMKRETTLAIIRRSVDINPDHLFAVVNGSGLTKEDRR